ncbi:heavy metal translocating P-type ATPase [Eisenibacter elegans]|uniref:heavy metal translocating P-type ATPase n=1 Tax=Eisenibacter elegans TaxID=997 RepID=UPI000404FE57|nr:heavy metal translocating P-type ATPase metal-binding domain-containing protein [Eisenibacter elegans]
MDTTKSAPDTVAQATCYHCGDACAPQEVRHFDEKTFCCHGCQTVYEILAQKDLCTYYDLSPNPGTKQAGGAWGERYAFLDNEALARQLISFDDGTWQHITLHLPTMHCSACIWLVEHLPGIRAGVQSARVNFTKRTVALVFRADTVSLRQLVEQLAALGYPPDISLEHGEKRQKRQQYAQLLYKIGIAGFCFGNIMLFSFPEYLALNDWLDGQYKQWFGYLSILLALPIVLYAASDYFVSAYQALKIRKVNLDVPIAVGIMALFGRSTYEILTLTGMGYLDSLASLVFFLLVGRWVQQMTFEHLSFERDYKAYFPLAIQVQQPDGSWEYQTITTLKKGNVIQVRNQELIPADGILLSAEAAIDYSFVTGEAQLIHKQQGDYLYAGGRQAAAAITLAVQKEVAQSYLTQLWNNEAFRQPKALPDLRLERLSQYFTLITLSIATLTALYWYWADAGRMWQTFTAVLIIACPCALALATPYALGNAMRLLGHARCYLRQPEVLHYLAKATHLVFDKTGTITQTRKQHIRYEGAPLSRAQQQVLAYLTQQSTHPLSRMVATELGKALGTLPDYLGCEHYQEHTGKGIEAYLGGQCYRIGAAAFVGAESPAAAPNESRVYVGENGQAWGYFAIQHHYRQGLGEMMQALSSYECALLSGDNDHERDRLTPYFAPDQMHFEQSPQDKLTYIQALQAAPQNTVVMIGDGLNDAGALRQSNVGIAITEDTTAFSPACDAILDAQMLPQLPTILRYSKDTARIIRSSLALSLAYNLVGVSIAVTGNLSPIVAAILMPISSITVVGFVIGTTYWAAKRRGLV